MKPSRAVNLQKPGDISSIESLFGALFHGKDSVIVVRITTFS